MDLTHISPLLAVGGMAAVGGITAAWGQIKGFLVRLTGFLIITMEMDYDLAKAAYHYCWYHTKRTPMGFGSFGARKLFVQPEDKTIDVAYESIGTKNMLFWKGMRPLLVGFQHNANGPDRGTVRFFRWTMNPEKFAIMVTDLYNKRALLKAQRFTVHQVQGSGTFGRGGTGGSQHPTSAKGSNDEGLDAPDVRFLKWSRDVLGPKSEKHDALARMYLTDTVHEAVEEVRRWHASQAWYKERAIPWRRGWLLYGPPGTGKSSFVRGIAQDIDIPIYHFDLGSMSNTEFLGGWNQALADTPCIVLIEDIDGVFNKRQNIVATEGGGLDFSTLLNAISGVGNSDGIFTIVTTNKLDTIDEALGIPDPNGLSSRPGRLDRTLFMPTLSRDGRIKIASRVLAGEEASVIEQLVQDHEGDTGAQFQERCSRKALELYWARNAQ
jgi:hypothetical protein